MMILATLVGMQVEYIQLISKRYPLEDGAGVSSVRLIISIFVAFSVFLWRRERTGCGQSESMFDAFCISFGLGGFGGWVSRLIDSKESLVPSVWVLTLEKVRVFVAVIP